MLGTRTWIVWIGTLVALVTGAVFSATLAIAAKRHTEFDDARASALGALTEARQAEAERWARASFEEAEGAFRAADSLHTIEDARFVLPPDFSRAIDQLEYAQDADERAVETALFEKAWAQLRARLKSAKSARPGPG